MRYLGIDVHVKTSVWCLLDGAGEIVQRGKTPTTAPDLTALVQRLSNDDELLVGQEVGRLYHFVHDTVTAAGIRILSFNAHHLRMICSSRKKTDAVKRLMTIPAVGENVALTIYLRRSGRTTRVCSAEMSHRSTPMLGLGRWADGPAAG